MTRKYDKQRQATEGNQTVSVETLLHDPPLSSSQFIVPTLYFVELIRSVNTGKLVNLKVESSERPEMDVAVVHQIVD